MRKRQTHTGPCNVLRHGSSDIRGVAVRHKATHARARRPRHELQTTRLGASQPSPSVRHYIDVKQQIVVLCRKEFQPTLRTDGFIVTGTAVEAVWVADWAHSCCMVLQGRVCELQGGQGEDSPKGCHEAMLCMDMYICADALFPPPS